MSEPRLHEFAAGIGIGLWQAYRTDIDVFLLFTSGALSGARSGHLRAFGRALALYTVYRRMDGYVAEISSKLLMLSRVIGANQLQPIGD